MSNAMKNGDQTAYPVSVAETGLGDTIDSHYAGDAGLTKREAAAIAALQGIMASTHYIRFQADMGIARAAVSAADELFKELSK